MKKVFLWLMVIVMTITMMVIIPLAGCKAEEEAAEEEAAEEEAAEEEAAVEEAAVEAIPGVLTMPDEIAGGRPVAITVAGAPADSQPVLLAAWEEKAARFKVLYPNVIIIGSDYTYSPDSFAALVAGNQVPTTFQVYLTDPGMMIDQGVPADLTSIFEANGLDEVYNAGLLSTVTRDGKIYGIPFSAYTMGLVYNISMLEDAGFDGPPTTWDELVTMAEALTDRDAGVAGFSFCTGGGNEIGWHMTIIAIDYAGFQNSDVAIEQADGTYLAGFDNDAMLSALNFIKELRWTNDVLPRELLGWATNGEAMALGRAAMAIMAGDQFRWIKETYPDTDMNELGFAALPIGSEGKSISLGGGDIFMVSAEATPDQIEAAAYFRLWDKLDPGEIIARLEAGSKDPTTVVGFPQYPVYVGAFQDAYASLEQEYANLPTENYKAYMDAVIAGDVVVMNEGQVKFQEYYGLINPIVNAIVTVEDTDPAPLLTQAEETYQTNVLDLIGVEEVVE